jgi:hypothetical protein
MDKLLKYINSLNSFDKIVFAENCGTTVGYLRKAISKGSVLSPALCVLIEQHSSLNVTRPDLHPDDWQQIWPELIKAA